MIELALDPLDQGQAIVPFTHGDSVGKSGDAIQDARAQRPLMDPTSVRAQLYALQEAAAHLPEVEMPLQHVHAPGLYARTIFIPAGTFVVGKIHKHRHLNILSQGEVHVLTESGGVEYLRGPLTMVSDPGTKRALLALTDVTWTTIHLVQSTDLEEIENEVIAKTYDEYEQFVLAEQQQRIEVPS